jgi:hypothetical protein
LFLLFLITHFEMSRSSAKQSKQKSQGDESDGSSLSEPSSASLSAAPDSNEKIVTRDSYLSSESDEASPNGSMQTATALTTNSNKKSSASSSDSDDLAPKKRELVQSHPASVAASPSKRRERVESAPPPPPDFGELANHMQSGSSSSISSPGNSSDSESELSENGGYKADTAAPKNTTSSSETTARVLQLPSAPVAIAPNKLESKIDSKAADLKPPDSSPRDGKLPALPKKQSKAAAMYEEAARAARALDCEAESQSDPVKPYLPPSPAFWAAQQRTRADLEAFTGQLDSFTSLLDGPEVQGQASFRSFKDWAKPHIIAKGRNQTVPFESDGEISMTLDLIRQMTSDLYSQQKRLTRWAKQRQEVVAKQKMHFKACDEHLTARASSSRRPKVIFR